MSLRFTVLECLPHLDFYSQLHFVSHRPAPSASFRISFLVLFSYPFSGTNVVEITSESCQ